MRYYPRVPDLLQIPMEESGDAKTSSMELSPLIPKTKDSVITLDYVSIERVYMFSEDFG